MKVVVAETTPVCYLAVIDHPDLLPRLFETIFIPSVVYEELQHPGSRSQDKGAGVHGTLGILIRAAQRQCIDLLTPSHGCVRQTSIALKI